MHGEYVSFGKREALFHSVVQKKNPQAFMLLRDAAVPSLCDRLRRKPPPLPFLDIEWICETGFMRAALRFADFRCWAQAYLYALKVALSLRRQCAKKKTVVTIPVEEVREPADPNSELETIRADDREFLMCYARDLPLEDLAFLLSVIGSTSTGASEDLGVSRRTERRMRGALRENVRKFTRRGA